MREVVSVVELLVTRCAGLDVAKDEVVACVPVPAGGAAAARRSVPSRPSPRDWRGWPTGWLPKASPRW